MEGSTVAAYADPRVGELAVWISTITTSIMWRPPCLLFVITRFILKRRRKKIFVHSHALRFQTYVLEMNAERDILAKTTSIPRRLA
jgi:hypothetical protein